MKNDPLQLKYKECKKSFIFKEILLMFALVFLLVGINPTSGKAAGTNVKNVTNFNELKSALEDINITEINLDSDIKLTKDIKMAQRNVTINGNKEKGIVLDADIHSIKGGTTLSEVSTLTLKNMEVVSKPETAHISFISADNKWNLVSENLSFKGSMFASVANGMITFSSNNSIHTTYENAKVRELIFAKDSTYDGIAAENTVYPAFRFSGDLVNGKASGTVDVQENANVKLTVSPNGHTGSFDYSAFYGKVYRIDVKENAKLAIDTEGTAIQFEAQTAYLEEPSFNVSSNAKVTINSRGGGASGVPAINFKTASSLKVFPNATFDVIGNSSKGVIASATNSRFMFDSPEYYNIQNKVENGNIFKNARSTFFSIKNADVNVWSKTGGEYERTPDTSWNGVSMNTLVNDATSSKTESTSTDLQQNFQMDQYGRISGGKTRPSYICPTFNPVNDQDTMLTGTGNAGLVIEAYVGDTKIGETVVDSAGRWSMPLANTLPAGTIVKVIQKDGETTTCNPVEQIVSHLSAETVNFFKLGYWQDYGIILEGSIDNADWDLSNPAAIHKYLEVLDENGAIKLRIDTLANTDWYQTGRFNGFQAIVTNEQLDSLGVGEFKLRIGIKIDGTTVDEVHDFNVKNTPQANGQLFYTGPYHQNYVGIESRDLGSKLFTTLIKNNIAYFKIVNK